MRMCVRRYALFIVYLFLLRVVCLCVPSVSLFVESSFICLLCLCAANVMFLGMSILHSPLHRSGCIFCVYF